MTNVCKVIWTFHNNSSETSDFAPAITVLLLKARIIRKRKMPGFQFVFIVPLNFSKRFEINVETLRIACIEHAVARVPCVLREQTILEVS